MPLVGGEFMPIVAMMAAGPGRPQPPEKLRDPVDLPDGTTTVARVQRPPRREHDLHWMVFDRNRNHVRLYRRDRFPPWLIDCMDGERSAWFRARIEGGDWVFLGPLEEES